MGSLAASGMCRLCGWEDAENQEIQELEVSININSTNILNAKVSELLQQNLNLSFPSPPADLPTRICQDCKHGLQVTSEFLMKVREGQIYMQKLLSVQGNEDVLEKNIQLQLDLQPPTKPRLKRGRPKKGFEKKRKKGEEAVRDEPVQKRRKKPPKHLDQYVDIEKIAKEGQLSVESGIDYEELKLNIDEDQDYKPPTVLDHKGVTEVIKLHKCDLCEDIFTLEDQLQSHVQNSHGEFMYRCANPVCELLVRSKADLEKHQTASGHQDIITLSIFQPSNLPQQIELGEEKDGSLTSSSLTKVVPTDVRLDHLDQTLLSDVDLVNSKSDVSMTAFDGQLTSFGTESVIISRNVIARTAVESCSKCLRTFTSETERKKHVCEETSCEACREEFSSKSDYLEHLNKVHRIKDPKVYPCNQCEKVFAAPSSLSYHRDTVHTRVMHKCNVEGCGMEFRVKNLLTRHGKVHGDERPYVCGQCSKGFKALKNLKAHQASHSVTAQLFCDVCGQTFKHNSSLNMHMKLHTGEKNHVCPYCNKGFTQNGNLKEHLRIHTGEKPFKCSECPKSFTTSSQLRHHAVKHSSTKPFSCDECNKRFSNQDSLKMHIRRHTGEKPYSCTRCKKKFVDSTGLKRHEQTHEDVKGLHICKICGKNYSDRSNLLKHMKTHKPGDEAKNTVWNIIRDVSTGIEQGVDEDELEHVIYVAYEGDGTTDQTTIDLTVKDGQQIRLVAPLNIDPLTFAAEYLKDLQNIPVTE